MEMSDWLLVNVLSITRFDRKTVLSMKNEIT